MGQRWVAGLAKYNFQLHYPSGKLNRDVDALSRIPWDRDGNLPTMDPVIIQAVITRGAQNCCAIPEYNDSGLFVHSGQVQVERPRFQTMTGKLSRNRMGTLVPCLG